MANLSRKHKSTLYLLIKKGWGTWGGGRGALCSIQQLPRTDLTFVDSFLENK